MLIGFIGTPSCGKSTTAFGLCYRLKKEGHPIEFVPEFARRRIIDCRVQGIDGIGGVDGQHVIYSMDHTQHVYYRDHANAITITDGSTVNCYFYGLDTLDLAHEAAKYDLLFYIPMHDVVYDTGDANRRENREQLMKMAQRWEATIRPLMKDAPNIVELKGYPHFTADETAEAAFHIVNERFLKTQEKKAA
jgi:hypothetical protein